MKLAKRQARAKRRAKTLRLVRQFNIPFWRSRWTLYSVWQAPVVNGVRLTPGQAQMLRKLGRRNAPTP